MNILRLHPEGGGPPIVIEHSMVRVGRDASSDVHLRDASVSRQHAEIERRGEEWLIIDQNSGNGTRIDGRRIQRAVLLPGQELHVGNLRFRVEIDRGDDGATMMVGRSPLLDDSSDRTVMGGGPPVFPVKRESGSRPWVIASLISLVVLVGLALGTTAYLSNRRKPEAVPAARPAPAPRPIPTPTPTPAPTRAPVKVRRPTGSLLISTDVDASVSIDGQVVARLKAPGLRRFQVAPGEHIVRFVVDGSQTETVARVRVNEQTVVRHIADAAAPTPTAQPSPSASSTPGGTTRF